MRTASLAPFVGHEWSSHGLRLQAGYRPQHAAGSRWGQSTADTQHHLEDHVRRTGRPAHQGLCVHRWGTPHRCGFLQEPVLTPGDRHPPTAGTTVATGPSLPSREAACTVGTLGRDPSPHLTRPAHHRSGSLLTQDSIPAA